MTPDEILQKAVDAALALAETERWSDLTLAVIAEKAGLSLADFHTHADKQAVSAAVEPRFDAAMSEGSFDTEETARTRLFDVIMMRFEAMDAARDGVMSYLRWRDRSFDGLALRLKGRSATAKWALTCAGLDGSGDIPRGVRITALAWVIAQAERAWRQETSADLSRTMAALDAELIKLEERAAWLTSRGQKKAKPNADQ